MNLNARLVVQKKVLFARASKRRSGHKDRDHAERDCHL